MTTATETNDATRRLTTGQLARRWRVDPSRVRQILRAAERDGFAIERSPGGHRRVSIAIAEQIRAALGARSTRNESG